MKCTLPTPTVRRSVEIPLDTGTPRFFTFEGLADRGEHIALVFGNPAAERAPLVRIHSECLTGDVFQSARCDCGDQLAEATRTFRENGGVLLYLRQEGRGIGLYNKLDAYALQDRGHDTYDANAMLGLGMDDREYGVAAQMLQALGIPCIRLLTNNPEKVEQMRAHGIDVIEQVSTGVYLKSANQEYLRAKVVRTRHRIGTAELWSSLAASTESRGAS